MQNNKSIKGLVSIIIPSYNRANLISETLESILSQTYRSIEILVIDDNSSDGTHSIVKKYVDKYSDLVFLYSNIGKGACAARNTGLSFARGEYIQFFDDDDIMLTNHIEKKVLAIEANNVDFVTCNYTFFCSETKEICGFKDIATIDHNISSHLLCKAFPTPSFLCRRGAIEVIGFWNNSIKKMQDLAYFHRLFLKGLTGFYLNESLFTVRVHGNSITSNQAKSYIGHINAVTALNVVYREWKLSGKTMKGVRIPLLFLKISEGRNLYNKGAKKEGIKILWKQILSDPIGIIFLLYLAIKYHTYNLTVVLLNYYK